MRVFEIHFIGGPFDGAHCRLASPPPDVLFLPIQSSLPTVVRLYSLTAVASSGLYRLGEYELERAARRSPDASIVLNYRVRRLLPAWRTAPAVDRKDAAAENRAVAEPVCQPQGSLCRRCWLKLKHLIAKRSRRLKFWLTAPVSHPLLVPAEVR